MSGAAIKEALKTIGKYLAKLIKGLSSSDDEGARKTSLYILIGILSIILIIPVATISIPGMIIRSVISVFEDEEQDIETDVNYDFTKSKEETKIFNKCKIIYNEFENDYNDKVADIAREIKYRNKIGEEIKIIHGKKIVIPIYPEVNISIKYDYFDIDLLIAYINTEYYDKIEKEDKFKFPKNELKKLLEDYSSLEYVTYGENPIYLDARVRIDIDGIKNIFKDKYTEDGISKQDMFNVSYESLKN